MIHTISKKKNILGNMNSRLDNSEEKTSEFQVIVIEIISD